MMGDETEASAAAAACGCCGDAGASQRARRSADTGALSSAYITALAVAADGIAICTALP